jgi:hypothetical protein
MEPACDIQCQRDKRLKVLMTNFKEATAKKGIDPEGYEKARLQYFSLKEGPVWLQHEKQKIAQTKLQPVLEEYTKRYNKAQNKLNEKENEVGDEDETRFIHQQIMKEKDHAGVTQRLQELVSSDSVASTSWWPVFLDVLIGLMVLIIIYLIYRRVYVVNIQPTI